MTYLNYILKRICKKNNSGKAAQIKHVEKRLEALIETCTEFLENTTNVHTKETLGTSQAAYIHALRIIRQEVKK
jgi:glutamate dehydrogenase/leucine dehydrogenase